MFSYTQLINPSVPLAFDYIPTHLTTAKIPFAPSANEERKMLDIDAATAAKALFEQASLDHISLVGVSGYRSYLSQKQLYENALKEIVRLWQLREPANTKAVLPLTFPALL